jgi:hypothetical protein
LKAEARRTPEEKSQIACVMKDNESFYRLEVIKERMLSFCDQENEESAHEVFMQLRDWIWESGIPELKSW